MSQNRKYEITDARGGAAFAVRVVTRAASAEIVGTQEDGTIKVRLVSSPAGDPAANQELITLLAEKLEVSKDRRPNSALSAPESRLICEPCCW
jgi:uncharacterized protein YggU (UPF0235/DUF167 family)